MVRNWLSFVNGFKIKLNSESLLFRICFVAKYNVVSTSLLLNFTFLLNAHLSSYISDNKSTLNWNTLVYDLQILSKYNVSVTIYFNLHDGIVSPGEGGFRALPDPASATSATRAAPSLNYTLQLMLFISSNWTTSRINQQVTLFITLSHCS